MASAPDLTGRIIGEYEIRGLLGVGGMGAVYEGRHPVIGKRVAVKVLLPALSEARPVVERFIDEARAVNAIGHRAIVDIFAFGKLPEGSVYFVMEYLDGMPLDKVIRTQAPLPIAESLHYIEEVCDALAAAHSVGIIHRDIKPSNIYVVHNPRGQSYVKLLDFGIAKLNASSDEASPQTLEGQALGTPDYMSPEQARGMPISAAADLYSTGCVLFELLTGRRVFKGPNPQRTMFMHAEDAPQLPSALRPEVPHELDNLVLWMLEKKPEDRPKNALEVKAHCAALREKLTPAPTPSPGAALVTPIPPRRSAPTPLPPGAMAGSSTNSPTAALRPARPLDVAPAPAKPPGPINVVLGSEAARAAAAAADFADLEAGRVVILARPDEPEAEAAPTKMVPVLEPVLVALRKPMPPPPPWEGTDKMLHPTASSSPELGAPAKSGTTPSPPPKVPPVSSVMKPSGPVKTNTPVPPSLGAAGSHDSGKLPAQATPLPPKEGAADLERTAPGLPQELDKIPNETRFDARSPAFAKLKARRRLQLNLAGVLVAFAAAGVVWIISKPAPGPNPSAVDNPNGPPLPPAEATAVEEGHKPTAPEPPAQEKPAEPIKPVAANPPPVERPTPVHPVKQKAEPTSRPSGPSLADRLARCEALLSKREAGKGVDPVLRGFLAQVRAEAANADTDAKRREVSSHLNDLQQQLSE